MRMSKIIQHPKCYRCKCGGTLSIAIKSEKGMEVFGKDEYWESGEPEDAQIDIFCDPHTSYVQQGMDRR